MIQSSKLTTILLAIIAVCLLAIVLKPAGVLPTAEAQLGATDQTEAFAAITASSKAAKEQVVATRAIATSIDGLAKSTQAVATAIDNLARATTAAGSTMAESQAADLGMSPAP